MTNEYACKKCRHSGNCWVPVGVSDEDCVKLMDATDGTEPSEVTIQ